MSDNPNNPFLLSTGHIVHRPYVILSIFSTNLPGWRGISLPTLSTYIIATRGTEQQLQTLIVCTRNSSRDGTKVYNTKTNTLSLLPSTTIRLPSIQQDLDTLVGKNGTKRRMLPSGERNYASF